MARQIERLTQAEVVKLVKDGKPGLYSDGAGLGLRIGANGAASWSFRCTVNGKPRERGLGSAATVDLKEARKLAKDAAAEARSGRDVIAERKAARQEAHKPTTPTFQDAAEQYLAKHSGAWKNPVHAAQWPASLERYVYPTLSSKPVDAITVHDVVAALTADDLWTTKRETANRVRARIEMILDFATANGWRAGDNPADRKRLRYLLPSRQKSEQRHHAALPYSALPAFMLALRARGGVAARCVEFLILTAARSGEARGATWGEIDLATRTWTIPASRMKGDRAHTVPLSDAAMALLETLPRDGDLLFPGPKGRPLSDVALGKIAKLCAGKETPVTTHGMRSTFSDWARDETEAGRDVVEMALAHSISDKTEAAYRRGDALKKRRVLMQQWCDYCDGAPVPIPATNVVPFKAA